MDLERQSNKSLFLSIISIMLCIALLIGTTLAWFTETQTNTGNRIEAGTLDINVVWYELALEGYEIDDYIFSTTPNDFDSSESMISDDDWQPGDLNAKLIKITNEGTLDLNIQLNAIVEDQGLEDALWYDFIQVDNEGNVVGTQTKRQMAGLAEFVSGTTFYLMDGNELQFILVYGMLDSVGSTYQGTSYLADIIVTATQVNKENTVVYAYDVEDINNAQTNQTVILMQNITGDSAVNLYTNVNFDLNGYTLTVPTFTIETEDYCTVDIVNGTIIAKETNDGSISLIVPNGTINIDDVISATDGNIILNGSLYTINLTGKTQFLDIATDGTTGEIIVGNKTIVPTIMKDTKVVVDTEVAITVKAEESATNVISEDKVTGDKITITEEGTKLEK